MTIATKKFEKKLGKDKSVIFLHQNKLARSRLRLLFRERNDIQHNNTQHNDL
jgi:hypothetical protein